MSDDGNVSVGRILDALDVGEYRALILGLVLVASTGSNQLGKGIKDDEADAGTENRLSLLNGGDHPLD